MTGVFMKSDKWMIQAFPCLNAIIISLVKADIVTLIRNIFPVEPGGHGKFAVVYSQSIIAVQVAVEAEQKGSGEGPWLALVVAEIF